jgi:hypothetical protein
VAAALAAAVAAAADSAVADKFIFRISPAVVSAGEMFVFRRKDGFVFTNCL